MYNGKKKTVIFTWPEKAAENNSGRCKNNKKFLQKTENNDFLQE